MVAINKNKILKVFFFVFITFMLAEPNVVSAAVEVYPGPGANAYKSDLYNVDIWDGSAWVPAYVYKVSNTSVTHWHNGSTPSVNFLTFGTTGQVNVRISKVSGSITSFAVSPKSKNISNSITGGQATIALDLNYKTWITINGDDANPLFIFADAPKPAIPSGAKVFAPGVYDIAPSTNNHYYAVDNEVIYLDGGAWVRGNIISTGKTNVQIMGPGVLSGELWNSQTIQNLGWTLMQDYFMIYAATYGVVGGTTVKGITIVNSPTFNVYNPASIYSTKVLSPWNFQTDGYNSPDIDQVFVFNGDTTFNTYMGYWSPTTNSYSVNIRITNSFGGTTNNAVFLGGFYGNTPNATFSSLVDNVDIKTYNDNSFVQYGAPHEPSLLQIWVDNNDSTYGYKNQTFQNIRIEGNVNAPLLQLQNRVYPVSWGGTMYNPPLGNSYDIVFKNIFLEGQQLDGTIGKKSEIQGYDANNGFHNVTLENVSIGGVVVNQSNLSNYFDVNAYVSGLGFGPPPTLTFSASPTSVTQGGSSTLTWSTTNATSCTASGSWTGTKATSGSQPVFPSANSTYTITCTNANGGTASKSVNVNVTQTNPIGIWTLDQTSGTTAVDTSGSGYSGTLLNYTGASWVTGKVSNGLNFDSVDDQVKITGTALNSLYGLTLSAWVNARSSGGNGAGAGTIVSKSGIVGASARFRLMIGSDGTSIEFRGNYSSLGGTWKTPSGSLPLNSWRHIVLTYTHEDLTSIPKIYIDGILQTLTTVSLPAGTPITDDDIMYIGSRGVTATSGVFDGTIDQVRVYNRELSSGEVTTLYNSENAGGAIDFSLSSSPSTVKVMQAKSVTNTVTSTLVSGTSQAVTFSVGGLPTGATAVFSPTSCSPSCTTTVTVSTLSTTPVGNSTITITGTAGAVTRTTSFTLDMNYSGDINLDGIVNSLDWSLMNFKWGTSDVNSDLNSDGNVNAVDFSLLNNNWFKSG